MEKTVPLENQPFFTVLKKLSRDRKLTNSYFHTLSEKDFSLACDQLGKGSENENADPFSLKHNRALVRFLRVVAFNYRTAFDESVIELFEDQEAFRCILFASNKLIQLGIVREKTGFAL